MLTKIISGGQTGVDIAAIDAAIECGFDWGGIVPKGFLNEDGGIDSALYFRFEEGNSTDYKVRTRQNVVKSDATLIFSHGSPTGGTLFTRKCCSTNNKPHLFIDFNHITVDEVIPVILRFLQYNNISVLNVAGPRLSKDKFIYDKVKQTIMKVIDGCGNK